MEEVMDAYGRHLIAADVLQVESDLGVWDTYNGLTGGEAGIAKAASYFGFIAVPNPPGSLQDLIGDSNNVYLVDSAPADRTVMSRQQFVNWWDNFSVELLPG